MSDEGAKVEGGYATETTLQEVRDALGTPSGGSNASHVTAAISTATTVTAPANTVGFLLSSHEANTAKMRWAAGGTASSTTGHNLDPGAPPVYIPLALDVSIFPVSGTQRYQLTWILSA